LLDWLYTAISWVMKTWHSVFSTFLDPAWGITWALSIMFLVVTVRLILFPLFVKQVKSQRAMQELQPEIAKLRKQYGSDRQGMSQAMMALQKERGVNPLAGCLPILPQIPIFLSLFHVLRRLAPGVPGLYGWSDELTDQAAKATLFGAPISASFNMVGAKDEAILASPGPGGHGAAADALRHAAEPLRLRLLLPHRRPAVLVHEQPLDAGPAVLHPPQDAAARIGRPQGEGRGRQARRRPAHPGAEARREARPPEAGSAHAQCGRVRRRRGPGRPGRREPAGRDRRRRHEGTAESPEPREAKAPLSVHRSRPSPVRPAHRPPGKPGRPAPDLGGTP
jgi:YidC/Oxa1 family membrane protein insertase